jgi:hypothetical protein
VANQAGSGLPPPQDSQTSPAFFITPAISATASSLVTATASHTCEPPALILHTK